MGNTGEDCLCTVDGTDFWTMRQGNMKSFWGHKFQTSGLCYEVAICIKTGWIVWIHEPFLCSDWPDIKIFQHGIKNFLDENEQVEADDGYKGKSSSRCLQACDTKQMNMRKQQLSSLEHGMRLETAY